MYNSFFNEGCNVHCWGRKLINLDSYDQENMPHHDVLKFWCRIFLFIVVKFGMATMALAIPVIWFGNRSGEIWQDLIICIAILYGYSKNTLTDAEILG